MQNLRTSARRLVALAALASAAVLGAATATVAPASAAPTWAPADQATLTPGVQAYTEGGQCTANFVFTDAAGGVLRGALRRHRRGDPDRRLRVRLAPARHEGRLR